MFAFARRGLPRIVIEDAQLNGGKATARAIEATPEEGEICGLQCGIKRL